MGGKRPDQHNIDPGEAGSTEVSASDGDSGIESLAITSGAVPGS